jgi:hypothetical protein
MTIREDSPRALGYQQVFPTVATKLTIPAGTRYCVITCLVQAIRWRDDGTDPTTTVGYPLAVGSELRYDSGSIPRFSMINQVAGAEVNISYYG